MTKWIETACSYDCPDACALLVARQNGELVVKGNPEHPVTRGFVCNRGRSHPARLASAKRLTTPLVRRGRSFREVDWNTAIDEVVAPLSAALEVSPMSIVLVAGGGSLAVSKLCVNHFFNSLGPITSLRGGVCDECGAEAQRRDFGDKCAHDYLDLENARSVVLWGRNPMVCSAHLVPFINAARREGKPIVLVDIRRSESAVLADRFVQVRPGGDGALAMAILRILAKDGRLDPDATGRCREFDRFEQMLESAPLSRLVDRAGVSPSDVEYLAGLYATGPVSTMIGWGLQRREAGGNSVRWIDALCMLSGQVGVSGGGANYNPGRLRGIDTSLLAQPSGRTVDVANFAFQLSSLDDPRAEFVYIYGGNPVDQFADSQAVACALDSRPFVVVADAFFTDTAARADVVLPVTLMFEEGPDAVGSYAHHWVARMNKVCDPPRGVKSDVEIVRLLRKRLGLAPDPLLDDPEKAVALMTAPWFEGDEPFCRNPCQPEVPFSDGFATKDGLMHLVGEPPAGFVSTRQEYPLLLLSPKRREYQHSQLETANPVLPWPCFVNPAAPGVSELEGAGRVRLVSELGSMEVRLVYKPELPKDVCVVPEGGWLRMDSAVNKLVGCRETDIGHATAFYDQHVRLEPIDDEER